MGSPIRMRQRIAAATLVVGLAATGCSGDEVPTAESVDVPTSAGTTASAAEERLSELVDAGMFVGGVAYSMNLVAIAFDRTDPDAVGMQILVTDGNPAGTAEWFEGTAEGGEFDFTSASGAARIQGENEPVETYGTITFDGGDEHVFFTRPAGHGAGIFEIAVDADGAWQGEALDGSTLEAQQDGARVTGGIVTPDGERYPLDHEDISRRLAYDVEGGQADEYVAVVTRRGTEVVGRGGGLEALKAGERASDNLIALDLPTSDYPEPGIYYGRLAFSADRMVIEVVEEDGGQRLRAYVSDSEPEPAGDIEWFTTMLEGDEFAITSASGDATMEGSIAEDGISGVMALPGSEPQRFFAAPAGDGAGIYDVMVAEDRSHVGTAANGATLELGYFDELVMGVITTSGGQEFDLVGADLADAYQYEEEYSQPGEYVAFAAPRGRFLFGRSGAVRRGSAGLNIIGLDKKC